MKKLLLIILNLPIMLYGADSMSRATAQVKGASIGIKQAFANQVAAIRKGAQQIQQSIKCLYNPAGCSAGQLQQLSNTLRDLNLSLMPLLATARFSKKAQSLQDKVFELQAGVPNIPHLTSEKRKQFISLAKKIAIATLALATAAIITGVVISGTTGEQKAVAPTLTAQDMINKYGIQSTDIGHSFIGMVEKNLQEQNQEYLDAILDVISTGLLSKNVLQAADELISAYPDYPAELKKQLLYETIRPSLALVK